MVKHTRHPFPRGRHVLLGVMWAPACALALVGACTLDASAQARGQTKEKPDTTVLEEPETTVFELSPIVVTASGSQVDVRNAPASVSVIGREELSQQPMQSIGEILGRLPGVTGGLSPTGELSKVKLRGLPDNYTLLLVDGRRVGTSRDVHYRPDMGRQDLNWISPEMIERIEVVRGPMSALYGSDAMGGVINIITRPVTPDWRGTVTTNYTLPGEGERGDAYQFSPSVAGPITPTLGLKLGAGYSRQNPDELYLGDGWGEVLGAGGVSDRNASAELTWTVANGHVLSFEGAYGTQESLSPTTANAEGEVQSAWGASGLNRVSLRAGHEGVWSFGTTRIDVYRNAFNNDVGEDATAEVKDLTAEMAVEVTMQLGVPHSLTIGGQYRREELTNTQTVGTVPIDYEGDAVSGATLEGSTAALFAEDQIALRPNILLTAGGRVDHHDRFGSHLSPRVYLVYHPLESWTVRGGVSRGFRAPTLKENSAGAATFSRGGGCGSLEALGYAGGGCYMAGNPDLEPEQSTSYEVGVGFANRRWDFGLTYFNTSFENKIEYAPLGYYQDLWWTKMQNIEHARTSGLEATATLPVTAALTWRANGSWMIEARNLDTGEQLITTPELSAFSSLDLRATDRLVVSVSAQYTGEQLGAAESIAEGYTMIDLTARFDVSEPVSLRAGADNVFDAKISSETGYDYYQPGRRFFAGVTTHF